MKDRKGLYVGIAITLYRRPKYTDQLFEALKLCYNIDKCDIHISCDWDTGYATDCDIVHNQAEQFADWCDNNDISCTVYQNKPRLGIDLNKLFVIPKVFEAGNDICIFLEDDTLPAKDALNYFVTNSIKYAWDQSIIAICGYNRTLEIEKFNSDVENRLHEVWVSHGFNPWSFAINHSTWYKYFGDGGVQYKSDTGDEANGRFDWWMSGRDLSVIMPVVARTQSVGGENATHTPSAQWHLENEFNPYGIWNVENVPNSEMHKWGITD